MRWLVFTSVLLACSAPPGPVDAGRTPVDAGPPRVVDGGLVGPFAIGLVSVSQVVRDEGSRTTASTLLSAVFTEVGPLTPNPCVERREGACLVRICNLGAAPLGTTVSAGPLTLTGLLPREVPDGGLAAPDAGDEDGGVRWVLQPLDSGVASLQVPQRLFFGGDTLGVSAGGDAVPAFVSPPLTTPAQVLVSKPRCTPGCPPVRRDVPLEVAWSGVSFATVRVVVNTPQVSVRCDAPAEQSALQVPAALLAELTPSVAPGDATLVVVARTAVSFDAGAFDVTLAAETPTFLPVEVLP
ncbi:MAG: hypothetical protein JNJ54_29990 [Myxococcaceae bacterium]|nr:hypothetical protein [Myxococcaceae bacterium]